MKNRTILSTFIILTTILFNSCAPKIVGTWNVEEYKRSIPGEPGTSASSIGTISFKRNGKGSKDLDYSLLGVTRKDVTPFKWNATEAYITIEGDKSQLSKTWIVIENKNNYQKWQSTDGANTIQTLELSKK